MPLEIIPDRDDSSIISAPSPRVKTRTEKVDDALTQILEGENVEALISKLSEAEQELFRDLVNNIRSGGISGVDQLDELWRVDYIRKPPTIEEFVTDPYWLGSVMLPTEDNPGLFPRWHDILLKDFDLDSRVHNTVITGSLGSGKTWCAVGGIFLYRVALARLLKNPQQFFGLSKGSHIYYAILSLSREVVTATAFADLTNFMASSPFFIEECKFDPERKYSNNQISIGNHVAITAGSKGWHVIGRNVMGVMLDEGNWRLEANPDEKAYKLYDEVRVRIQNRFQRIAGFLPAISLLSSSARDESAFTEKVIQDIQKVNDPSTQTVYRETIYRIKSDKRLHERHRLKLGERWFKVAYGVKNIDPVILSGWYDLNGVKLEGEAHEEPPPGSSIELVPEIYHDHFRRNCRLGLQSIAGISVGGSHRLFSSMTIIERAIELGEKQGLKNPCTVEFIPLSQEDDKNIWDYLDHPTFVTRRHSRVIPLRHPSELRYAHLDLATESMAGLGVCHRVGRHLVQDVRGGEVFEEYRMIVEYDFILTIVAGQYKPISLEKVQRFIFWLRDYCGFQWGLVTADQWQAVLPLEMLSTHGIKTKQLSMDRTKGPYYSWRSGFNDSRIRLFRQEQLMREAEHLVDGDKVDHPSLGGVTSKDTTDGAGGCYYGAITEAEDAPASSTSETSMAHMARDAEEEEEETVTLNKASKAAALNRRFNA